MQQAKSQPLMIMPVVWLDPLRVQLQTAMQQAVSIVVVIMWGDWLQPIVVAQSRIVTGILIPQDGQLVLDKIAALLQI